jgi:thiol-disulfide isomerase/thioredoxin
MKKIQMTAVFLAVLLLFSACGDKDSSDEQTNTSLSGIQSTDILGNAIDDSVFSSHDLTMVNFWSITCPPCIREMPDLALLNDAYDNFQVVGVVLNISEENMEQLPGVLEIVSQTGAHYTHLAVSESLREAKTKHIQYVPETIFVDSKGNQVGVSYVGAKSYEAWDAIIQSLLDELK